ncbi:MAG: hypothetical protein DDT34_01533 [Firmicutes bacterium]|nr:hypothetical protein [Bacillota bacterium]
MRQGETQVHRSRHVRFIAGGPSVSPVLGLHLGYSWMKIMEMVSPRKAAGLSDVKPQDEPLVTPSVLPAFNLK